MKRAIFLVACCCATLLGGLPSFGATPDPAKWSEQPEADVLQVPSPAYAGEYGRINRASVEMQQAFWVSQGLVKTPVAIPMIVDSALLDAARRQLKIR
jgi:hypothetical protein